MSKDTTLLNFSVLLMELDWSRNSMQGSACDSVLEPLPHAWDVLTAAPIPTNQGRIKYYIAKTHSEFFFFYFFG